MSAEGRSDHLLTTEETAGQTCAFVEEEKKESTAHPKACVMRHPLTAPQSWEGSSLAVGEAAAETPARCGSVVNVSYNSARGCLQTSQGQLQYSKVGNSTNTTTAVRKNRRRKLNFKFPLPWQESRRVWKRHVTTIIISPCSVRKHKQRLS